MQSEGEVEGSAGNEGNERTSEEKRRTSEEKRE